MSKEGDQSSSGWGWGSDWGVGNLDITSTLNSMDVTSQLNAVMESAQSIDISSTVNSLSEQASTMVREMEETVEREYKAMEANEVAMAAAGAATVGATVAAAASPKSSENVGLGWTTGDAADEPKDEAETVAPGSPTFPATPAAVPEKGGKRDGDKIATPPVPTPAARSPKDDAKGRDDADAAGAQLAKEEIVPKEARMGEASSDDPAPAEDADGSAPAEDAAPPRLHPVPPEPKPSAAPPTESDSLPARIEALEAELAVTRETLNAREAQLLKSASKATAAAELELALNELRDKLAAAEHATGQAIKERDQWKRQYEKSGDNAMLLKEKDAIIQEVMEEGENLSKKQMEMEMRLRERAKEIKDLKEKQADLVEQAVAAKRTEFQADLKSAMARAAKELDEQKSYYIQQLTSAKTAAAAAEAATDSAARQTLGKQLKEAEESIESLKEQVEGLQQALTRASEKAAAREERLAEDLRDAEQRLQESDARHEELAQRLPESTRPLLRQIETMRAQESERAEAWSGAERVMLARVAAAEEATEVATAAQLAAEEDAADAKSQVHDAEAAANRSRAEADAARKRLQEREQQLSEERARVEAATEAAAAVEGKLRALEDQAREREGRLKQQLAEERGRLEAGKAAWEREGLELESSLAEVKDKLTAATKKVEEREEELRAANRAKTSVDGDRDTVQAALDRAARSVNTAGSGGAELAVIRATEELQRQIRSKEVEITIVQDRVKQLEASERALSDELVRQTQLMDEAGDPRQLRAELQELEGRHIDALELMGETSEENEELKDRVQGLRMEVDRLTEQLAAAMA
jgi:chromosome segregation ATPase